MQLNVQEWAESPVNEEAIKRINTLINSMEQQDCYCAGEPQKTQELMVAQRAVIATWSECIEVLQGDWDLLESEDE